MAAENRTSDCSKTKVRTLSSKRHSKTELAKLLTIDKYPRSSTYDPDWVMANLMGPNVLWLAEALTQTMELKAGMRVLDLGCGKALSSIFLAKEFGVEVWATDLWIKPTENWARITAAGLQDKVFPIYAEAHALPFAEDFFDALVSFDAYHYFGTDDLYLGYYSRFAKENGYIGIVAPGLNREFAAGVPPHLEPYWESDFWTFHSPDWWRDHWQKSRKVNVETADIIQDGWKLWLKWLEVCDEQGAPTDMREAEMLRVDNGRNLGVARILGRKKSG